MEVLQSISRLDKQSMGRPSTNGLCLYIIYATPEIYLAGRPLRALAPRLFTSELFVERNDTAFSSETMRRPPALVSIFQINGHQSISCTSAPLLGGRGGPNNLPHCLPSHSVGTPSLMPSFVLTQRVKRLSGFSTNSSSGELAAAPSAAMAAAIVCGFAAAPRLCLERQMADYVRSDGY